MVQAGVLRNAGFDEHRVDVAVVGQRNRCPCVVADLVALIGAVYGDAFFGDGAVGRDGEIIDADCVRAALPVFRRGDDPQVRTRQLRLGMRERSRQRQSERQRKISLECFHDIVPSLEVI